jgi:uncharacterized YccA/Bax inhibitor family protein
MQQYKGARSWHFSRLQTPPSATRPFRGCRARGLIVAMITIFKKEWSPITAPAYALLEGLVLGGLSAVFEIHYPGIAIQAVGLTFGVLFVMLFLYRYGVIKVTDKFRMGVVAATGGIALFYLVMMVLRMFGVSFMGPDGVYGSGMIGIGFSLLVVGVAALNLVLDFDFIERGVNYGAPKYMEWYGAFGIMMTLCGSTSKCCACCQS